jgi:hypothetical protein
MPRLYPPFAQPGQGRRATPILAAETSDEPGSPDFLESLESGATESRAVNSSESLPSIDRFVDDLPLIDEFLLELNTPGPLSVDSGAPTKSAPTQGPGEIDSEGWAAADWQSYDWSGLASLGAPEPEAAEAHASWLSTNWDSGRGGRADSSMQLREEEVAAALVEIARRIRSGELSLHKFRDSPPEAAIAAAFASLLQKRG